MSTQGERSETLDDPNVRIDKSMTPPRSDDIYSRIQAYWLARQAMLQQLKK